LAYAWSPRAFRTVFLGFSALAATTVSNQIQYGGGSLVDARGPIIAFIVCECLLLLAPQFFFGSMAGRASRRLPAMVDRHDANLTATDGAAAAEGSDLLDNRSRAP
jgi:hypothetical protein